MATNLIQWAGGLLPATVAAAIVLFVAREVLEWFRRRAANRRKLDAIKNLLARECELNLWSMNSLKTALGAALEAIETKPPGSMVIVRLPSGNEHWEQHDAHGQMHRGGPLPSVRRTTMESVALGLAELDASLFGHLDHAMENSAELDHLRGTLVDFADSPENSDPDFFGGFLDWALEQFDDIYESLNALYRACTGNKLEKARLR